MQELETVLLELNTVRSNAKVYKQQQNSSIFFLADINTLKAEKEKELNDLQAHTAYSNDEKAA